GRPNDVSPVERVGRIKQVNPADFVITLRCESSPNEISFVRKEKSGISIGGDVDTGAVFQVSHGVGLPDLIAVAGIQANKFSGYSSRINVVSLEQSGRSVAQNSFGNGFIFRPEN